MEGGAGDRSGELREEGGDERCCSAMGDEEDCLGEFGSGLFHWTTFCLFIGMTRSFFWFGSAAGIDGRSVSESAEIDEEINEVNLPHLRWDEDVFLNQSCRRCDSVNPKSVSEVHLDGKRRD